MKSRLPMTAPGWISMPVTNREKCEMRRATTEPFGAVERVRNAMKQNRVQAGIAKQDLEAVLGGRIPAANRLEMLAQRSEHV